MERIAVISPLILPLPNIKGGGVELLVQFFIDQNEISRDFYLTVFSIRDKNAAKRAKDYKYTQFVYIRDESRIQKLVKRVINKVMRMLFKREISFCPNYVRVIDKYFIRDNKFDKLIVENCYPFLMKTRNNLVCDKYYHLHYDDIRPSGESTVIERQTSRLKNYKKIICVSNYIRNQVEAATSINNCVILKNCTDIEKFTEINSTEKTDLQRKYGISGDEIVIMYSGRLIPEKGVLELVEAFKKICGKYPVKLLVVGAGTYSMQKDTPYVRQLKNSIACIKEKVVFTGYVNYDNMPKLYNICDFTVVPTLFFEEAAPLVAIEALAAGKPIIISDSGGLPEYVNSQCSICVKRGENIIDSLANAMETLAFDERLRCEMGRGAKALAKVYHVDNYYMQYKKILSEGN